MLYCKHCGSPLSVDEEYMQGTYGAAWTRMPDEEKSWYCSNEEGCGEAGMYHELATRWKEITKEQYWYFLEVLPPLYGPGLMFAVGEALRHNAEGKPVYTICDQRDGKFWQTEGTYAQMWKGELSV